MHDAFISFSFEDQPIAEKIADTLVKKYGISCWICSRNLSGGQHFKEQIPAAIDASSVVVFIQSSRALESREIPKEISLAFDAEKLIIPFRLDDAKPKGNLRYDLAGIEYIDATKPTMDARIAELAASINEYMGRTSPAAEGSTPVLHSTPVTCSEIFHGRDDVFNAIDEAYAEGRSTVFLRGMGGIGKSEIARQYIKSRRDRYNTVVFARYEDDLAALIAADSVFAVEGAARRTRADGTQQTDSEYALDKLAVIKKGCDSRTLIVIDNFDVAADPFLAELTSGGEYRVLVTTRVSPERGKYHVVNISELDDSALRDMFIDYADPDVTMIDRDDPAFAELFALTDRHTLTLELTAKYMSEKCIDDVGEMVALLRDGRFSVLSDSENRDGFAVIRNLFRFTALSENERAFLRHLAMMPPEGIDQQLFRKWNGDVFKARARLASLSLIQITASGLSLHPVIRDVVISELKPSYENCREFIDRATMVNEDYVPLMWNMSYGEKKQRLDCYMSVLKFIRPISAKTYPVFLSVSSMSNFVSTPDEAIRLCNEILLFTCDHFGSESSESMTVMNNLGWKYSNCRYLDEAMDCYGKVTEYFLEHPDYTSRRALDSIISYVRTLIMKCSEYHDISLLDAAQKYIEKFIDYGSHMLKVTTDELGKLYVEYQTKCAARTRYLIHFYLGDYEKAAEELEEYRTVVEEYMHVPGISGIPDMASYRRHLGQLKYAVGEYETAISNLLDAYSVLTEFFSTNNLNILETLELLTLAYLKTKDLPEARKYLDIALGIAVKLYTDDHPLLMRLRSLSAEIGA